MFDSSVMHEIVRLTTERQTAWAEAGHDDGRVTKVSLEADRTREARCDVLKVRLANLWDERRREKNMGMGGA